MAIVVKIKNKSSEHEIRLAEKPFSVGRSSKANLTLDDDTLSRVHCTLYLHNGTATVKDNGSKNGILRNGSSVLEHHLYIGDTIEVGDTVIRLLIDRMTPEEKRCHKR